MSIEKESKLELCESCKGYGRKEFTALVDNHSHDYKYMCTSCSGSGIIKVTTVIERTPYIFED